jgi:hypothetical protein
VFNIVLEVLGTAVRQEKEIYELTSTPELLTLAAYVSGDGLAAISGKRGPLDLQTLYAPVQGNARTKKWEWVGRVWGTFGIALEI